MEDQGHGNMADVCASFDMILPRNLETMLSFFVNISILIMDEHCFMTIKIDFMCKVFLSFDIEGHFLSIINQLYTTTVPCN